MARLIVCAVLLLPLLGCNGASFQDHKKKDPAAGDSASTTEKNKQENAQVEENTPADEPAMIAGSYLTCQEIHQDTVPDNDASIGCSVLKPSGSRYDSIEWDMSWRIISRGALKTADFIPGDHTSAYDVTFSLPKTDLPASILECEVKPKNNDKISKILTYDLKLFSAVTSVSVRRESSIDSLALTAVGKWQPRDVLSSVVAQNFFLDTNRVCDSQGTLQTGFINGLLENFLSRGGSKIEAVSEPITLGKNSGFCASTFSNLSGATLLGVSTGGKCLTVQLSSTDPQKPGRAFYFLRNSFHTNEKKIRELLATMPCH